MLDPISMMKLIPKAKKLVQLSKDVMDEYEQNVKKYGIKSTDTKEYYKLKAEIEEILEKEKK